MDEPAAALRPIDDAGEAVDRLESYESTAELGDALRAVASAVERSLRLALRADASAPDADRLSALSTRDLALEAVVKSLRTRDLISLETAGTVHELEAAAARARAGRPRPADADVALRAVARLRKELGAGDRASASPTAAPESRAEPGKRAPSSAAEEDALLPPEQRGRSMAILGAVLAVLFVGALAWVLVRGGTGDYEAAMTAFRAGRLDSAAVEFERVLEDRPDDVGVMLYLGRIYRRQARYAESAEVLQEAATVAPGDADVRRELGHLLMELNQPESAVRQYERALEEEPDEPRTWAALIRALRAAGDPRAERLLADAPAEVQALLGRPDP